MAYIRFLCILLFFISMDGYAITQQEAEEVVDSVFYRRFQCHYIKNVTFYDGSIFRVAYAAARSGPIGSGGCGYTLINSSIGVTFDLQTDSTGANDEGITILKINPVQYPTLDSARNDIEDFVYENITGTAEIQGLKNSQKEIQVYPNPAKHYLLFSGERGDRIMVYNMLGQRVFSERIIGSAPIRLDLGSVASGRYVYVIDRQEKKISGSFIRIK